MDKLLITKFKINNTKSVFIKLFLFFILKDLYLNMNFNVINFFNIITYKQINKKNHKYLQNYTIYIEIYTKIYDKSINQSVKPNK